MLRASFRTGTITVSGNAGLPSAMPAGTVLPLEKCSVSQCCVCLSDGIRVIAAAILLERIARKSARGVHKFVLYRGTVPPLPIQNETYQLGLKNDGNFARFLAPECPPRLSFGVHVCTNSQLK
jgi:hypothetical protein